jgi:hypothetical protein
MDNDALRLRIRHKLVKGTLPQNSIKWLVRAPSRGHRCDACATDIPARQHLILGETAHGAEFHFHLQCFDLWIEERQPPD